MKQYTNSEQTAKLIELGFERPHPKWELDSRGDYRARISEANYSIGELIEMLPPRIKGIDLTIDRYYAFEQWLVYWNAGDNNQFFRATELIDALFNAIA